MPDSPDTYDPEHFPRFAVTTELVVLAVRDDELVVGLVRRGRWPYEGMWALPGGFVRADLDASLERAARRQLVEEAFLRLNPHASPGYVRLLRVEQVRTYWRPGRDPRPGLQVAAVAYLVVAPRLPGPAAGDEPPGAGWAPVADVLGERVALAFDHAAIVADAVERARAKLEDTALATAFLPPEFTVDELRRVYETVWGTPLDKRNFHRKVTAGEGFLEATGHSTRRGGGRPAGLYRHNGVEALRRPILRPRLA
jgi:8-oxo-dGTP diphosphatase